MTGFNQKDGEKEIKHGFLSYKAGQWVKYRTASGGWNFGQFKAFRDGELILGAYVQPVPEERGEWPAILEKEKIITVSALFEYGECDKKEVDHVMKNYSPLQQHFDKYVLLPVGGTDYLGKINRLFINSDIVELLPYVNYKQGEPYIEKERPIKLKLSQAGNAIPRTEEDLEWRVNQIKKHVEDTKKKNGNGSSLILSK
jgi:hypothetical protein